MINKDILINFINKYNLDSSSSRGETAVIIKSQAGKLATMVKSEDKSVLAQIVAVNSGIPDGKFAVFNTSTLLNLVKLMQSEFNLVVSEKDGKYLSWQLQDELYNADFRLADPSIIPSGSTELNMPKMDIKFDINSIFIDKYLKSLSALPTALISFSNKKGKFLLTVNHSQNESHKISIPIDIEAPDSMITPIIFDANRFKDILSVNKDSTEASISISTDGLMALEFKSENINSKYYMVSKMD